MANRKKSNWQKISEYVWYNQKADLTVGVERGLPEPYGVGYIVYAQKGDYPRFWLKDATEGDPVVRISDAVDAAKRWMRRHPNG
jgi:hypothetical protein